jgi:serine/threonine-protein kinase
VRVIVSQGPSELQTPNLVGEHYRKADMLIRQAGFVPGNPARVSSEEVPRDTVIAQDPPAGTPLDKGGTLNILVSGGKRPERFAMPDLIGKRAEEAIRIVDSLGLQHRLVYKAAGTPSPSAVRTVVSQKPPAGYPVTIEASVELVVSK